MDFKHIENRFRPIYNRIFFFLVLLAVSCCITIHPADLKAAPKLSSYFKTVPGKMIDSSHLPNGIAWDLTVDINSDGHQDYIVFGQDYPGNGVTTYSPQPSRVLLGDGEGGFVIAPRSLSD